MDDIKIEKLNEMIKDSGIALTNLSSKLDITYAALWNKMSGKTHFTLPEAKKLKNILHLSDEDTFDIFFGEDVAKNSDTERGDCLMYKDGAKYNNHCSAVKDRFYCLKDCPFYLEWTPERAEKRRKELDKIKNPFKLSNLRRE